MQSPLIRAPEPSDLAALVDLLNDGLKVERGADTLRAEHLKPYVIARVLAVDQRCVGYLNLWYLSDIVELTEIVIHEEKRRLGYGAALLHWAIEFAQSQGARALHLEVRESNSVARRMYENSGFVAVGCRPRYYAGSEDAVLYSLEFSGRTSGGSSSK